MKKGILALLLALSMMLSSCIVINLPATTVSTQANAQGQVTTPTANEATEGHADSDSNGLCDDCGCSVILLFDFYVINDLHGKFSDTDSQPGVDELTTYLKRAYATDENALFLSSGDMWQGSSESNLTQGHLITEWMNELDFVAMTLGNHEFDWGVDAIESNLALAEFPFLAINIINNATGKLASFCTPSIMVERSGLQIGIIGAIGDCYSSISPDQTKGISFVVGNALTQLVKEESQRLREAGADYIIYSIHDGYEESKSGTTNVASSQLSAYYGAELSKGYVDLVFEGHTHQRYVMVDSNGVYHLQNGGDNKGISHAEVAINFANGSSQVTEAEFVSTTVYSTLADDPLIAQLIKKYEEQVSGGYRVLGRNAKKRQSSELRQLLAQLYYEAGMEKWGSSYQIALGGGFFTVRSPYTLAAGEVTYADLLMLLPFDNELVLCSIKGRDLKSKFYNTTNENYFIAYGAYGESLKNNIDDNATYYIVVDTYTSTYKYNNLTEIQRFGSAVYARDLLASYIEAGNLSH